MSLAGLFSSCVIAVDGVPVNSGVSFTLVTVTVTAWLEDRGVESSSVAFTVTS